MGLAKSRSAKMLKAFVPPKKFMGREIRYFPSPAHVQNLVKALFPNGTLHAPELWSKLQLDDPVDADVTEPGKPEVVFSYMRKLVGGGSWYRTRLRLTARVVFDWIDWAGDDATDGSEEEFDVTAWYTDTDGKFTVDPDRTDLQPAPIYTSSLSFLDPTVVRGLTSSVFAGWKSEQFRTSVALGAELVKGSKIKWTMPVSNLGAEVAKRGFTAGLDLNSLGAAISRGSLFGDAAAWSSLSGGQERAHLEVDDAIPGASLEDGVEGQPDDPVELDDADEAGDVNGPDEPGPTGGTATSDRAGAQDEGEVPGESDAPDGSSSPA